MQSLKKNLLHIIIVMSTILLGSQSCNLVTPSRTFSEQGSNSTNNTSADYITVGGMKYLVVSTLQGIALANVTKDSLEVIVRRRNEKYLELANRPYKQK